MRKFNLPMLKSTMISINYNSQQVLLLNVNFKVRKLKEFQAIKNNQRSKKIILLHLN